MNSPLRDAVDGATICAISTAPGAGGIAVVRISGSDALALGSKVFSKPLDAIADRSVAFGRFRDAEGTVLDEGLARLDLGAVLLQSRGGPRKHIHPEPPQRPPGREGDPIGAWAGIATQAKC